MGKLLISEILNNYWLIDTEAALGYKALFSSIINGEKLDDSDLSEKRQRNKAFAIHAANKVSRYSLSDSSIPQNSTAVIPIRGEIMKYDQACGPRGTMSIIDDIRQANSNPNIGSILLVVDSPGGMVTHTDLLAEEVKNSKTPIVSYVEGLAASAAYWIISGSSKIIVSSDLNRVGSIGTMLAFADVQPYYEKLGVKFIEFYATKSTEKNKDFNDILNGKYDDYRKNVLDVINEKFHSSVKSNRAGLSEKTLTGKTFFGPAAIELGLVDEIGSMEYAIDEANKLALNNNQNTSEMKIKINSAWKAIIGFFGMDESKENELNEESVNKLNDELQARGDKISDLESKLAASEKAKTDALAELETAKTELTAAKNETAKVQKAFDEFKAEDASEESIAKKKKDEFAKGHDDFASADYNKMADNL